MYRPALQQRIGDYFFEVGDKVTASIVRVDHLERLEQDIIGGRRKVARYLGGQDVVVRVADGQLLHRLQVQLENNGSVGCRRRSPIGWMLK